MEALLGKLLAINDGFRQDLRKGAMQVPMFYAAIGLDDSIVGDAIFFSFLCGLLHIVSWFFATQFFPSKAEIILLGVSSLIILFFLPCLLISQTYYELGFMELVLGLSWGVYFLARLSILAVGLSTLRATPPTALHNIQWPHIIIFFIGT